MVCVWMRAKKVVRPSLVGRVKARQKLFRGQDRELESCGKKLKVGHYKHTQLWDPCCTYV